MKIAAKMPPTAKSRNKVAPIKLAHLVLRSTNKDRLVAHYKTLLEAEVFYSDDEATFLTYDDEHHRLAIVNMPALKKQKRNTRGMDHIAFTYASIEDLLATYERLKGEGILPIWTTHHGGTLSFYYEDPDRNFCELQIDVYKDADDLVNYVNSKDFDLNPIGVNIDPEEFLERFRKGEGEETLLPRTSTKPADLRDFPRSYLGNRVWLLLRFTLLMKRLAAPFLRRPTH